MYPSMLTIRACLRPPEQTKSLDVMCAMHIICMCVYICIHMSSATHTCIYTCTYIIMCMCVLYVDAEKREMPILHRPPTPNSGPINLIINILYIDRVKIHYHVYK